MRQYTVYLCQTTGSLFQATRLRLPSAVACNKAAQRSWQNYYQLITIHAEFSSSSPQDVMTWCNPCHWILLTTKSEDSNSNISEAINPFGSFSPNHLMVDYEISFRNVLTRMYPNCDVNFRRPRLPIKIPRIPWLPVQSVSVLLSATNKLALY